MKKRVLRVALLLFLAATVLYCLELGIPKHDYFIERVGMLTTDDLIASSNGPTIRETRHLESTTGLKVDLRLLRPATPPDIRLPVLLLLGGQRTGKDAVDLVGEPDGVAFVAIDYPYTGDQSLDGFVENVSAVPEIQKAFIDSPPALLLVMNWLMQQHWVDRDRVELVGISLGVPFTVVAGALDDRFHRVWLLHGGADNASWVAHAGRDNIETDWLRHLAARGALFLVYGNSFDTRKWMQQVAPRPLIVVAARDDDYVPAEAQADFIEAAESEHIELIWTEGQHIGPRRENELQQLLELVHSRIGDIPDSAY